MTLVAVAPTHKNLGFDGTGREVRAAYEVMDLEDALLRTYKTDAHLVTYVVRGQSRQCRINKPGLPYFDGIVETHAFICDVDNPGHGDWTPALVEESIRMFDTLPILKTCGMHHTLHGRHIIQPLAEPIPVQKVEPYLRRWLLALEQVGIVVDWSCRDWTRHFRLPNVRRSSGPFRSPVVRYERMQPIHLDPLPESELAAVVPTESAASPRAKRLRPMPTAWTTDVPAFWHARIAAIADAVRGQPGNWHELFLALSGAMLARSVPGEHVPEIVRAISIATGADSRTDDRERGARSTVERHALGAPVAGYSTLRRHWPLVAQAVDAALATGNEARLRAQAQAGAPEAPVRSLAETTAALEDAIRHAPDGLTLIKAECGLGKTHAAMKLAIERAAKSHASATAAGTRAPLNSKTAISVDKNELAEQVTRDLRAHGAAVKRIFGPLSMVDARGKEVCKYAEAAQHLVAGGQSLQWELCLGRRQAKCPHYDTCPARDGVDGPSDARITVGPHALLRELDGSAGTTGLLVIDEPPALLEHVVLTADDLRTASKHLASFDQAYGESMTPALSEAIRWLSGEEGLTPVFTPEARQAASQALQEGRQAPALSRIAISIARDSVALARVYGKASHVLGTLHRAATNPERCGLRVDDQGGERVLVVTLPREALENALKREGAVVVTDANVEVHQPIYAKVLGHEPQIQTFTAVDGAPIRRTVIRYGQANRKSWFPGKKLVADGSLVSALRAAIAWANEDPTTKTIGLITMRVVELAIAATLHPGDADVEAAWVKDAGQEASALTAVRQTLGPVLAAFKGQILLAHYGGVRGLNTMADVDAVITLGDPWTNLGTVQHEVAFLGLEQSWEARMEALCRAELEQAHGRIRAIHRQRPGRALHVGNTLPGGRGWAPPDEVRHMEPGPPPSTTAMSVADVQAAVAALGGNRAVARTLGCSPATISNYLNGKRPVPESVATALRASATGVAAAE